MRIFRKRPKHGSFQADAEPLPDIVYQMGAEAAQRYVRLQARAGSPNPHDPMNFDGSGVVYEIPHQSMSGRRYQNEEEYFYDEQFYEQPNEPARSSSTDVIASAFGFNRQKKSGQRRGRKPIKEDRFAPIGSPVHFQQHPPGTPVHFQHRAASPEFAQARAGSPYHFAQQERVGSPVHFAQQQRVGSPVHFAQNARPSSPDVMRRLQRAQQSQELQRAERQQRRQQEIMMAGAFQMAQQYPYGQQAFYPNMQALPILQAPQLYQYY